MNNYEFCTQWILDRKNKDGVRVLDYGCGAGEIVKECMKHSIDISGCDVFYEGGDYSNSVDSALFGSVIKRIEEPDYVIPFESQSFDIVVNNQVMEHVDDLDRTLYEIHRVLKPGGMVLSLFPTNEVWREGHCGIPFLHWFPKYSQPRIYYAVACRFVGLGYYKQDKSVLVWSRDFCDWLDQWTYYRKPEEIHSAYEKYFTDLQHIEDNWLQSRFGSRKLAPTWLPVFLQKIFVRKLGGWVFYARKP